MPLPPPNAAALGSAYLSPQVEVAVRLNTNEAPEPPPAELLDEIASIVRTLSANRYPDRTASKLRAAIAAHHGLEASEVFAANGSNEVLQCLYLAYGGAGRQAAIFEPTYALHAHIARLTGTEVLAGERGADYKVDLGAARALLASSQSPDQPSITLLCSPNNPTGGVESPETVARIAELVPGLLVVDEAYGQFAPWTAIELLGGAGGHDNVVVVRTFSKTWAMAGLRLGYMVAPAEVVVACQQVALPYHLDAIKQAAGVAALAYEADMRSRVSAVVVERARVTTGLEAIGMQVWPSDANFVLFRAPGWPAATLWQGLLDQSVLVRDVSGWHGLEGCLRVTIGTPAENTRFLEALASTTDTLAEDARPRPWAEHSS